MKKLRNHTLVEFSTELAKKTPVPGGGSVAALSGALATGLLAMVANYSVGRKIPAQDSRTLAKILSQSEKIRKQFLDLVDQDAQAYLKVVAARGKSAPVRKKALKAAARVPAEVARLSFLALGLAPALVAKGSPYLLSDVEVAVELLEATFKSALINIRVNQS